MRRPYSVLVPARREPYDLIVTSPHLRPAERVLTVLVVLIALHSFVVGLFLLFATRWGLAFGGWGETNTPFFPRQAGVFHFVVAAGYVIEYFRYRGITLMLTAKTIAVVFLVDATFRYGGPWAVPMSAAGDAAMLAVVWWTRRRLAADGERPAAGQGDRIRPEP